GVLRRGVVRSHLLDQPAFAEDVPFVPAQYDSLHSFEMRPLDHGAARSRIADHLVHRPAGPEILHRRAPLVRDRSSAAKRPLVGPWWKIVRGVRLEMGRNALHVARVAVIEILPHTRLHHLPREASTCTCFAADHWAAPAID